MKNKAYIYAIIASFCGFLNLMINADPIILLTLEPYPLTEDSPEAAKALKKLKKPGSLAKMALKALRPHAFTKGIFATYAGDLNMSNADGQIIFLRKHIQPFVYLLITDKITPVMMAGNTINKWNIEDKSAARMYKIERNDENKNGLSYWSTEEVPLPDNLTIPNEAITIIAKPKNVYVAEGISFTENSPNLVLPSIYIKKDIRPNDNALYILNLRQFFGPLHTIYKSGKARNLTLTED